MKKKKITVQRPEPKTKISYNEAISLLFKAMEQTGDSREVGKRVAIAQQLFTQGNRLVEEAYDIMQKYGLNYGKVKTLANNLCNSFEAFNTMFSNLMNGNNEAWAEVCYDHDILRELLDAFMENNIEVQRGQYYQAKLFLPAKTHQTH